MCCLMEMWLICYTSSLWKQLSCFFTGGGKLTHCTKPKPAALSSSLVFINLFIRLRHSLIKLQVHLQVEVGWNYAGNYMKSPNCSFWFGHLSTAAAPQIFRLPAFAVASVISKVLSPLVNTSWFGYPDSQIKKSLKFDLHFSLRYVSKMLLTNAENVRKLLKQFSFPPCLLSCNYFTPPWLMAVTWCLR